MVEANIKDVATLAGVSTMTVTRTLNTPELVKKSTRQRVQDAIRELNYIPNRTASALRSLKSKTVGIAMFDIENPFMSKLVMRLENSLKARNYITLVSVFDEEEVDDFDIYARLRSFNADLSIFIPTEYSETIGQLPNAVSSKLLQVFRRNYDNVNSLEVDDIYGAYIGTKHLLENGHRRILLIDFDQRLPLYRDRGYTMAFEELGLEADAGMILKVPEFQGDYEERIRETVAKEKPTAILAVTQKLYDSTLDALRALDLRIREDVSLVGYDDSILAHHLGITTVAHPFDEMASAIVNWAIDKITESKEDGDRIQNIQIKPYLNIRSSVKNLNEEP